jgi:tetraacyldisaccharide 4'-kinase
MKLARARNLVKTPSFLSRGYGGMLPGPLVVTSNGSGASAVGDEALLLVRQAPVIVSADRRAGAVLAAENGNDLIIMDDGLQNPALVKALRLVVIDGACGLGNKRLLPAGPLRVPLREGVENADAFVLIGEDKTNIAALLPSDKPLLRAELAVSDGWVADKSARYVAFCGLGRPGKFRATLEKQGLNVVSWYPFPDHHFYTDADLKKLQDTAKKLRARLITTEKDAARLPSTFPCETLPVQIVWQDEHAAAAVMRKALP